MPLSCRCLALLSATFPVLAACYESTPTLPRPVTPDLSALPSARCHVDVAQRSLTCEAISRTTSPLPPSVLADRIVGGQDVYVKLVSSGTAYNGGTAVLSSDVTLQNLTQFSMGTTDGVSMVPVRVFVHSGPNVTSGTGTVTVLNAGTDTFLGTAQPYYAYAQTIAPFQISNAYHWEFSVPATVNTFDFTVYVSAPMTNETGPMLDRAWTGGSSAGWAVGSNWLNGLAPDASSVVAIPPDSLIAGVHSQPVLPADASVTHLRVGFASSLDLATHVLTASGNVDAVGAITNGTLMLTGPNALLGGTLNVLTIPGHARVQRLTVATGAVTVTGSLSVSSDQTLSIQLP